MRACDGETKLRQAYFMLVTHRFRCSISGSQVTKKIGDEFLIKREGGGEEGFCHFARMVWLKVNLHQICKP